MVIESHPNFSPSSPLLLLLFPLLSFFFSLFLSNKYRLQRRTRKKNDNVMGMGKKIEKGVMTGGEKKVKEQRQRERKKERSEKRRERERRNSDPETKENRFLSMIRYNQEKVSQNSCKSLFLLLSLLLLFLPFLLLLVLFSLEFS